MMTDAPSNKALVLEAFVTLFDQRNFDAAQRFWSENYIQHSALIPPGREALFKRVRSLPAMRYENQLAVAEGDYVMLYGRFSGINDHAMVTVNVIRVQDGQLAEHWDIWEKESTRAESLSGLPMFGDSFPEDAMIARREA
jgi:predicted SnoaL-like aldol condensation-catalyzing enzyme